MKTCPQCRNTYPDTTAFCARDGSPLEPLVGLPPGTVIGRKYEIVDEIGRGGMGVVYRAVHKRWQEERALKFITSEYMADPEMVERLLREALLTKKINHPNVVRVDDIEDTDDGQIYVVMEYVAGQSLRTILQSEAGSIGIPLQPRRALVIASQVAAALAAAHAQGIIHRDIKPDNILVSTAADGSDLVKVVDFGIAKARIDLDARRAGGLTKPGVLIGTALYTSPEQASFQQADERSDIYSLGVVLFEMLTGRPPFIGDETSVLKQRLDDEPPSFAAANLTRPLPDIERLVMKALRRNPAGRQKSAEEMRIELDKACGLLTWFIPGPGAEAKSGPNKPIPSSSVRERPFTWRKVVRQTVIVVALLILIVAFILALYWNVDRGIADKLEEARSFEASGRYDDCIRTYNEILTKAPTNARALAGKDRCEIASKVKLSADKLSRAEQSYESGEYNDAIQLFQSLLTELQSLGSNADSTRNAAVKGLENAKAARSAEAAVFPAN